MKKNILVFPCGSEIGLEIHKSVKYSTHFNLIGASSIDDHGQYVYEQYIGGLPFVTDKNVINELKKIIIEKKIDAIYPTTDTGLVVLKENEKELGCKVIAPSMEVAKICESKELTYELLKSDVLVPRIYNTIDEIKKYPVFVKPKIGAGSRGAKLINSRNELEEFIKNSKEDNLILEYLPGEEYTIDCFTNKDGKLLYFSSRKRNRIKAGMSVNTSFVENQEEFKNIVETINSKVKFRGAWFIQVKRDEKNRLVLLEIADRLGGSSGLCRAIGINFAQMTLFDAFDVPVYTLINDYKPIMDRASNNVYKFDIQYKTVYVDYDDCLILDKKEINIELVEFLYKCINNNIKIILLSKHDGNLVEELKKFRLFEIFDEIIHIEKEDEKSKYIKEKDAILIDDSFVERKKAKENCNINVFSPDMVCTLF